MALDKIFSSAADEDKRREGQKAELERIVSEQGREVVTALENIHAASKAARKAMPWSQCLSDDATELHLSFAEYIARPDASDERHEKTYFLGYNNYGRGINITFRDNGTMKIEHQNKLYVTGRYANGDLTAIPKNDRRVVYDDVINVERAQTEIGIFVSQALHESAREKLQTALATITPSSGSSPQPQI